MPESRIRSVFAFALVWALGFPFSVPGHSQESVVANAPPAAAPAVVEVGTHWASPTDFPTLRGLGYNFAITTVDANPATWSYTLDAAEAAGLNVIVGMYPPPYRLRGGVWSFSPSGISFLHYLSSRPSRVKGIFVFNEPYWVNPSNYAENLCGAVSASELRILRAQIRSVWTEAKIYHDLGQPSAWSSEGWLRSAHRCIGDKYADQSGVADFVGIWFYPFDQKGYRRAEALEVLRREVLFVTGKMKASPIVLNQSFRCPQCGEASRWPTSAEMLDWNCASRELGAPAVSWYTWRNGPYVESLADHPGQWHLTTAEACTAPARTIQTESGSATSSPVDAER